MPDPDPGPVGRRLTGTRTGTVRTALIIAVVTIGFVLAGCGTSGSDPSAEQPSADDQERPLPMNVSEASAQPAGTEVTVEGFLVEDTGLVFLSELLAESYPPQPGGSTLLVEGLDLSGYDGVNEEGPIQWLDIPVTITGTIGDGVIADARPAEG